MGKMTRAGAALALVVALGGCTTMRQTYPDATARQVWSAMVAVARSPSYDDWDVLNNETWVDEEHGRIEIYRQLRRVIYQPVSRPRTERREWRFEVVLEKPEPPTVAFVSRGLGVPSHAQAEANRFFVDVWTILGAGGAMPAGSPEDAVIDSMGLDDEPPQPPADPDEQVEFDDLPASPDPQ